MTRERAAASSRVMLAVAMGVLYYMFSAHTFVALFMDVWVVGGLGGWVWGLRGSASRGR